MALPQDGVNMNELPKTSTIPTGKELLFIDPTTNEGGVITLEDLTKQILQNLTSQTFALDQGTKTLPAALNELNSKTLSFYGRGVRNIGASRKTITIQADGINEKCFFVILAGATDTRCVAFIYGLKSNSDEVNYTDIINNKVSFSGSREDNTITINSGNWSRGMIYSYEPFTVETT